FSSLKETLQSIENIYSPIYKIMRIAFFSTKAYDKQYFKKYSQITKHEIVYFDIALSTKTVNLTTGCDAVCVFVNDKIDKDTIEALSANGIKAILLRCAGYNNIDIKVAIKNNIK